MPNTIAHFAIATPLTRRLISAADIKWIYLACIVPDLPWILQRILVSSPLNIDLYDLRAYAVTQSSLLFSVLFGIGVACCFRDTRKLIAIFTLGSLIHLFLDSLQIKWANGVQYFLPLDWQLIRLDLFWPESIETKVLTIVGFLYFIAGFKESTKPDPGEFAQRATRRSLGLSILAVWLIIPLTLTAYIYENDNHYLATIKEREQRVGKYVEFDRNVLIESGNRLLLNTAFDEQLSLDQDIGRAGDIVSIQGFFDQVDSVNITRFHLHSTFRDKATKLGLLLIVLVWLVYFIRTHRYQER